MEAPELLDRAGNLAVIHMPGRRFPGLLVQGDTLASIRQLLESVQDPDGLPEEFLEARERINELTSYYESVLRARGIRLPY